MCMRPPPFQRFLDDHRSDVHRYLLASVGPQLADDCFQETFLSALRAYPRLRDGENLRGWVLTIAARKAVDAHRSAARRPVPVGGPPDRANPELGEHDPALWAAVRALPPKQRDAVTLRFVNDLAYREIAAVIGCSEDAARQSVRHGVRKLKEVLT